MNIVNLDQKILIIWLTLASLSGTCHAEIYKWVDANGQTHFSERAAVAGAKPIELEAEAPATPPRPSSAQYWKEQERQFQERQWSKRTLEQLRRPQLEEHPKSLSGGTKKFEDSDTWRCNLAKDIISGAVRHSNGFQTTGYDIKLAKENVRAFCH
jgi:hypothetical protein